MHKSSKQIAITLRHHAGSAHGMNRRRHVRALAKFFVQQCLAPSLSRAMATEAQLPADQSSATFAPTPSRRPPPPEQEAITTVYSFPAFEPLRYANYPQRHLLLPLRRDILQRAIVFEGDNTRQGTASTKWRDEVHGSHRKARPQKGLGRSRMGTKQSPLIRGGGVAFGPKPRDFSTKLPRKIYDLAWRTALSYRYQKGQLIVVQKFLDEEITGWRWVKRFLDWNDLATGGSMIVTRKPAPALESALLAGKDLPRSRRVPGMTKSEDDVDVKDLLTYERLVIEKRALDSILQSHCSDLVTLRPAATYDY